MARGLVFPTFQSCRFFRRDTLRNSSLNISTQYNVVMKISRDTAFNNLILKKIDWLSKIVDNGRIQDKIWKELGIVENV